MSVMSDERSDEAMSWPLVTLVVVLLFGGLATLVIPIALTSPDRPWWLVITSLVGFLAMYAGLFLTVLAAAADIAGRNR